MTKACIITQKCYMGISGHFQKKPDPTGTYLLKVNNRNTRTRCETWSKLTKTSEQRQRVRLTLKTLQQTLQDF